MTSTSTSTGKTGTGQITAERDAPPPPAALKASPVEQALGALEEMGWLDTIGEAIARIARPVTDQRGLMDALHGRWLGHALHPVLSDLPIGFWVSVPVLDIAGDDTGATVLTAAGCIAAVGTAVTGAADWTVTDGRERRLGLLHGLANAAGTALQLGALGARLGGGRRAGRWLSLAGLGVSSAAAYLGGELVFGRGLMVDHTAWMAGPKDWTPVLDENALAESRTHAVQVEGRRVLVARIGGMVSAMEDACSHAGGPLSEGTVSDGMVTCPWHGSRFRLRDGAVCQGPATYPQLRLEARVRGGVIEVRGREG